jgi:hypothetical protein
VADVPSAAAPAIDNASAAITHIAPSQVRFLIALFPFAFWVSDYFYFGKFDTDGFSRQRKGSSPLVYSL